MARNTVDEWSSTPSDNTDVGGINIDEGCPPSNINNAIRTVMAQVHDAIGADSNYTKAQVDAFLALKYDKTGGVLSGNVSVEANNPLVGLKQLTGPGAGIIGYLHNDGLRIGFLDPSFQWLFQVNLNTGAVLTKQIPDLKGAIDAKAPLASPALTGTPTAPTAPAGTNTTQIATMAALQAAIPILFSSEVSVPINTVQQNLTGKPIWISVSRSGAATGASGTLVNIQIGTLSTNLVTKVINNSYVANGQTAGSTASWMVPPGYFYRANTNTDGTIVAGGINAAYYIG